MLTDASNSSIMKNLAAKCLFFLLFVSSKLSYCIACPEIEQQSLLIFKQSLKDPSNLLSSWKGEVDCCKWKGVVCSNLTGHVHRLHLRNYDSSSQGLSGEINPSLLNLKNLEYLDLSQNHFKHSIPSFIGSLTSLEYLNLSSARFYGKIPYTIGNLSNLHTLIMEETYLENFLNVDSLEWLSGLSKLEHLNMNYVNLSKAANWAEAIGKLSSLVELRFSYCSLNDFTASLNYIANVTSSLAILDLSVNNFQSSATIRNIFQLSNLIFLDLSYSLLEGPIPSDINSTKLKHVDLSLNNFNSSIPEWLYFCKDLEFVSLLGNHLQNEVSDSIANLTSLNTLDLSYNELSGKVPREIPNLCRLQMLNLCDNKLQGDISDSFGNMSGFFLEGLESLDLSGNRLLGHLTHQFAEFKNLHTLDLSSNSLSGEVPKNIGNLSSLEYLNLGGNKFTANLPASVGKLFNLKRFDISNNMLEGVVTETHFAHLSNLKYLYISRNQLTLKVSPNWTPPFKLETLRLGSLNLGSGSQIPSWLETQKKTILELDLSCTGISGNVPNWIWNIHTLNLSHNTLHGEVPVINDPVDGYYSLYRSIYLSSNKFRGPLPQVGNRVDELDLSNNSFSGGISHFLCDKMTSGTYPLEILHLGDNHLSGELPDCFMMWPSLSVLNLGNNNFSGTIPNSIGFLSVLSSLNLYGNKFSGRMPFSMHNCTQLVKIDLAGNDLVGSIPKWIGTNLSYLKFLILRSNKLSGEISSTICQLSSLQILDLSENMFSGVIPKCVNNFTAMTTKRSSGSLEYSFIGEYIESASVDTKGRDFQYDTILVLVTNIDLSNNHLSGDIPKELTTLVELRSLNLSNNHLTGMIPETIGNMKQLESLDFSLNSLSGEIPSSFTAMSSLSYLNMSYNNLTGRIPESTQLQGFNKSSFIGNNLCGPPLTNSCNNDGNAEDQDQEGDEPEIEWFYVFVSLGHAVGLSGFLTTLYYMNKSWRDAYYEFFEDMWNSVYVYFYVKWRRFKRAASSGRNS